MLKIKQILNDHLLTYTNWAFWFIGIALKHCVCAINKDVVRKDNQQAIMIIKLRIW